jgi:hypothetical protein
MEKNKLIIITLGIIIILFLGFFVYYFWIKPSYQTFIENKKIESYNLGQISVLSEIINQIQKYGYVQIPIGNQTIYLNPFNPEVNK